uniref:Uncharacterized protein n=1 Tax=Pipistrellus kuhlii TaxID=59472 RepID=A0A7J7X002_PIPKU|nr:hypothetical protein mPipKuh1_010730 [Pipistrellus kuhlii]
MRKQRAREMKGVIQSPQLLTRGGSSWKKGTSKLAKPSSFWAPGPQQDPGTQLPTQRLYSAGTKLSSERSSGGKFPGFLWPSSFHPWMNKLPKTQSQVCLPNQRSSIPNWVMCPSLWHGGNELFIHQMKNAVLGCSILSRYEEPRGVEVGGRKHCSLQCLKHSFPPPFLSPSSLNPFLLSFKKACTCTCV